MYASLFVLVASENNNTKSGAPPSIPPPPPPADMEESLDSQSDSSFNMELSRNHHDQYDMQFAYAHSTSPPTMGAPAVTIIGEVIGFLPSVVIACRAVLPTAVLSNWCPKIST